MSEARAKRRYGSPRQQQRQSLILASARKMLDEVGYAGMTMRGLAERADVVPATLYNLYGGKDELILAAVRDLLESLSDRVQASGAEPGVPMILVLIDVISAQITATPRYAEAMTRLQFADDARDSIVEDLYARSVPFIEHQLRLACDAGQLDPDVPVTAVAELLNAHSWGVILGWLMGRVSSQTIERERRRSAVLVLLGVAQGAMREELKAQFRALC